MKKTFCRFEASIKKNMGIAAGILLMTFFFISRAIASDFQIQPMTMELSSSARSGVFSVINNNAKDKIDFQVSAKEWNQDEKGKDVLTDTQDIVFFPKVMTVDPNSQRAIRVGLKVPPSAREKTYRLFVQEIPTPKKTEEAKKNIQAGVSIAFRFSMPIFLRPIKPQETYMIDKVDMSKGSVKAMVKNTGNVHVKLRSVKFSGKAADGKELFTKEVAGWYILNGLSFPYEAVVPKDICGQLSKIDVNAQTEKGIISGTMNVQKNMCIQ